MNSKAFSSIIGAIFMILIMGSLASAYFFFTMAQNTTYNDAVRDRNLFDVARLSESVQALDTSYEVNTNNVVTITCRLQNTGSSPVQLVTLWVYVSENSGSWTSYNFANVQVRLTGGETKIQSFDVTIQGASTSGIYTFTSWFITSKGNSIPLKIGQTNTILFAEVAAGIGSIAMDNKAFRQYVVTNGALGSANPSYTVSRAPVLAFSVDIINLDKTGKELLLNEKSSIWVLNPPASNGAIKGYTWYIAKVTGNSIASLQAGQTISLPYGQPVKVYFYNPVNINQVLSDGAAAVNLLLVGKIATTPTQTDYGQNLPFIAITIAP